MNLFKKLAISTLISLSLFGAVPVVSAATLQGFQGGTGFASTTSANVGAFLQVASTSPFLTYTFATTTSSGGSATTTITAQGALINGPNFTFATSGPLLAISVSGQTVQFTDSSSSLNLGTAANQNISFFLQAANNLSDLNNVSSSLVNLRLSTSSVVTFGSIVANAFDPQGNKYTTSTIPNLIFTNASGSSISVTGYGLFPTLNFTNSSGTNLTASGYLQSGNIFDLQGNRYSTSTVSTSTFSFGVSFSSSSATQSPPLRMPFSGTIFDWKMSAGASCSGQYDVWKAAGAIPTKSNTIVGTDFPTLTNQTINSSTALSGWTKTFSAGDYFIISATSTATTCNAGSVQMDYIKN